MVEFVRDPNAPQVKAQDKNGPPWTVEARLDRIVTAKQQTLQNVVLSAESDGRITRRASLQGWASRSIQGYRVGARRRCS